MLPSPMAGCFCSGPFSICGTGAPMADGYGDVHLEPDHCNAGPVAISHVVVTEIWSKKGGLMPEIIVDNLVFPDALEENCPGFKKGLVPGWALVVGDFGEPWIGRS